MSDHILLHLSNKLWKRYKCETVPNFFHFLAKTLIHSILQEYKNNSKLLYIYHYT